MENLLINHISRVGRELPPWKRWFILSSPLIMTGLFALIYYPTFEWFWLRWVTRGEESYYSHGPLIPVLSAFLIWRDRNRLRDIPIQVDNRGLLILLGGLFLQLFSAWARVHFTSGISLVIVVTGLSCYFLGRKMTRALWFPLFFLLFMVPMPLDLIAKLSLQLKLVAASLASSLVNLVGIPNILDGSTVFLPNTTLVVDDPCSGLRSLITFVAMGSLYAYIVHNAPFRRWILVLLCIPIAIFANLVRVVLILIISNQYGSAIITNDFLHKGFGLLVFVVGLISFFLVAKLLKLELPIQDSTGGDKENGGEAKKNVDSSPLLSSGKPFGISLLLLGLVAITTFGAYSEVMDSDLRYTHTFPHIIEDWRFAADWFDRNPQAEYVYKVLETRDTILWEYKNASGTSLDLALVYSPHNRKVSHPPDVCFEGGGWEPLMKDALPMPYGQTTGLTKVNRMILERGGEKQVALYWYKTGNRQTSSYLKQQVGFIVNSVLRRKSRSVALIRLTAYSPSDAQIESKTQQLEAFAKQIVPLIDKAIP